MRTGHLGLYQQHILPRLTHFAMRQRQLLPYRQRTIAAAKGRVLEVGIGSALNVGFYGGQVERVIGIDPSPQLLTRASAATNPSGMTLNLVEGSAEAIPLTDRSVDTVVMTWTLCSIPDAAQALAEMRRVLARGGRLLFVEHGRAPDANVVRWQDRMTPLWKCCAGGCHLNRPIASLVEGAGFRLDYLATGYAAGPKPMSYMYEGSASVG